MSYKQLYLYPDHLKIFIVTITVFEKSYTVVVNTDEGQFYYWR